MFKPSDHELSQQVPRLGSIHLSEEKNIDMLKEGACETLYRGLNQVGDFSPVVVGLLTRGKRKGGNGGTGENCFGS